MAEQRLPVVGSDDGTWGGILREYLLKEHYNGDANVTPGASTNGGHKNVTIRAGGDANGGAPLKFTTGTLLTTAEAGAMEFAGDHYYLTTSSGTRKKVAMFDDTNGAQGDLYYRDGTGHFIRLPIGSTDDVLTVSGGVPTWQAASGGSGVFADNVFTLQDNGDNTKQLQFDLAAVTAGQTTVLSVPDADTTIVGTDTAQILTNKTIDGNDNILANIPAAAVNVEVIARPEVQSTSILAAGSSSSVNIDVPSGVQADDIIVVFIYKESTASVTPPSGFAATSGSPAIYNSDRLHVYWKRATGNDTGTYNFTLGASAYRIAAAVRLSGCITSGNPFDVEDADSSPNSQMPTLSMTTTVDNTLLLWAGSNWDTSAIVVPTGFDEEIKYAPPSDTQLSVGSKVQAAAGSTGSVQGSATGSHQKMAWMGALKGNASTTQPLDSVIEGMVTVDAVQALTNKTFDNTNLLNFTKVTGLQDANGNDILFFGPAADAVNALTVTNQALGGSPGLTAGGADTNIDIGLSPKGAGGLYVWMASGNSTATVKAQGDDANINLNLTTKGTGKVQANGTEVATISGVQTLTNKDLTSATNTFPTFNQNTTGSAAKLTTARNIQVNLGSTSAASFDGSANITPGVTGTLPVTSLGTGRVTGSNNGTPTSLTLWKGTQAQYDALGTWDSNTIYVVTST